MGVAGLAMRPARAKEVIADIHTINKDYGVTSEVKWNTAKARRKDVYKAYIDLLFALISTNSAHLHIRFVPMHMYAHNISGSRNYVDTISKQFYQLFLHRAARYYGEHCKIMIRPDKGDCTSYLPKIMDGLNHESQAKFRLLFEPFTNIEPRESQDEPILQLLDVTIGAMCAARNGTPLNGALGSYKCGLVEYALLNLSPRHIGESTPIKERQISLWSVKPSH
jgi:hypothetical protein